MGFLRVLILLSLGLIIFSCSGVSSDGEKILRKTSLSEMTLGKMTDKVSPDGLPIFKARIRGEKILSKEYEVEAPGWYEPNTDVKVLILFYVCDKELSSRIVVLRLLDETRLPDIKFSFF